jgi:AraC family transcriptional regulator
MEVSIQHVGPWRVAFTRHIGPYDKCGPVWEEFLTHMGAAGHLGAGTMFIGLCHDDPDITPRDKTRYDCCVTVDEGFEPNGPIGVQTISEGDYAVTTHHGPYDALGDTYGKLCGEWIPTSGRVIRSAPCLEVYLNSPEGTEPEELLTDIYMPLEPR